MPSFTTIFRAIVMLAVGAVIVKGWQLFGPSSEQVKSAVVSAVEMAEATWKGVQTGDSATSTGNPGVAAPPFAASGQPAPSNPSPAPVPALTQTPLNPASVAVEAVPNVSVPASPQLIAAPVEQASNGSAANDERIAALLSRLKQMSVTQQKLAPWGSSGHLYRFCCQAALTDSPEFTRHFESVAEEPTLAVEQVVAKVEAWRISQRGDGVLRY